MTTKCRRKKKTKETQNTNSNSILFQPKSHIERITPPSATVSHSKAFLQPYNLILNNIYKNSMNPVVNEEQGQTYQVQLAIYDLSGGMARALSSQFLGPNHAIDIIPHTAILAFGKEYYFGGAGIEASDPHHFRSTRGIFPIEVQHLGHTNVSKEQFEEWCLQHMDNGVYASHSYDLFHRNCNNFSHHAATEALRLNKAVPEWILSVPSKVLASPLGEMIRPMLQQMQVSPSGDGRDSFESARQRSTGNQYSNSSANDTKRSATDTTVLAETVNPWANLPSSSAASEAPIATAKSPPTTPFLDSYNRPLIANDTHMVNLCIDKIKSGKAMKSLDENTRIALMDSLSALPHVLTAGYSNSNIIKGQLQNLMSIFDSKDAADTEKTFALMLVRILVLQKSLEPDTLLNVMNAMRSFVTEKSQKGAMRAMAWCVLSNALGSVQVGQCDCFSEEVLQSFADLATTNISENDPVEVRRGSAAFLYNLVLFLNDKNENESRDVSDLQVGIICTVTEGLLDEKDVEVATRIMLVIGKIVKPCRNINNVAATLLADVGCIDTLTTVRTSKITSLERGDVVRELADEIAQTVSSQI